MMFQIDEKPCKGGYAKLNGRKKPVRGITLLHAVQ